VSNGSNYTLFGYRFQTLRPSRSWRFKSFYREGRKDRRKVHKETGQQVPRMYHVSVQTLPQAVATYVRKQALLKPGDRVGVAVSGGADSVALLRLLLELRGELGVVLSVVHFNHKLRGAESDEDECFVAELARQHKLDLSCESGDVFGYAAAKRKSLEAAARELRYQCFRRLLVSGRVNRIATAHTLDDQAETVLLRIVRGAGSRGLAGIYPQLAEGSRESGVGSQPTIIRPLLGTTRSDLETYLVALDQPWREDTSNRDLRHARNRIRHGIVPRLERHLNPAVCQTLAETAEIARAEEEYWEEEVQRVLPLIRGSQPRQAAALKLKVLGNLPLALQRRVVRAAAESSGLRLEFRQVEEILTAKSVVLPDGWAASRNKTELWFERQTTTAPSDYEYCLPVPGRVEVRETGSCFEARLVSANAEGYNPEDFLDRALLNGELRVRNWRPGDRFWPAHTKAPKKIKELLQERHLTGTERKLWPVVVRENDIVWMRGFAAPGHLRPKDGAREILLIQELKHKA
jgi:tRNA(Ile)-lysidine synthase